MSTVRRHNNVYCCCLLTYCGPSYFRMARHKSSLIAKEAYCSCAYIEIIAGIFSWSIDSKYSLKTWIKQGKKCVYSVKILVCSPQFDI